MVLKIIGIIVAEGNPPELALYTHTLLEIFKMKAEFDQEKQDEKDRELVARPLIDLVLKEMENAGLKDKNGAGDPERKPVSQPKGNAYGQDCMGPAPEQRVEDKKPGESAEER